MNLTTAATFLNNLSFDTSISDNVLSASKEEGRDVWEISLDQSGQTLVTKSQKTVGKSRKLHLLGQTIPLLTEFQTVSRLRLKLSLPTEITTVLRSLDYPISST